MEHFKAFDLSVHLDPSESLYLTKMVNDGAGLSIVLSDLERVSSLTLTFKSVYCFRYANESYRLKLSSLLPEDFPGIFSEVENSLFVEWFHDESRGLYIKDNLKHFLIYSADDVIDVINHLPPAASYVRGG